MMRQNRADFRITVTARPRNCSTHQRTRRRKPTRSTSDSPTARSPKSATISATSPPRCSARGKQALTAAAAGAALELLAARGWRSAWRRRRYPRRRCWRRRWRRAPASLAGFVSDSYITNAGQIMGDLREAGVDPSLAKKFGMAGGAIMAGLDLFGIGFAARPFVKAAEKQSGPGNHREELKKSALKEAGKDYLIGLAGETGAETAQQIVQDVTTDLAKQAQSGDFKTIFNDPARRHQVIRNAVQTAIATAEGMAVIGVPGAAVTHARISRQNADMERGAPLVTPEDHASPLPTDLIQQGKGAFENALKDAQGKSLEEIAAEPVVAPEPTRIESLPDSDRVIQPEQNQRFELTPPPSHDTIKAHMRQIESGGNDRAANPNSSAAGRYQFTDATWESLGGDLSKKLDPNEQERMMDKLLAQNEHALSRAGVQATAGNLYLAHFLGSGGAIHALENPNAEVDAKVQKANPFAEGWTNAQLAAWANRKMGGKPGEYTSNPNRAADQAWAEKDRDADREEMTFPTIEHKSDELLKEHPETLSGDDLMNYTAGTDPSVHDEESLKEEAENYSELRHETAKLQTIPLSSLRIEHDDEDKLAHYRTLKTEAPPIVVRGDKIVDGNHRATIAQERGETSIRAYVIQPQSSLKSTEAQATPEHVAFAPETGTLGIPRAEMPQIKAEHRGAMVNFLNARGIEHQEETVPASSLKPTQAEYIPAKVEKALGFEGGDRAILVSQDNHIVDGQHQALAAEQKGEDVRIIRLNAPIRKVLAEALNFPSSTLEGSSPEATAAEVTQPESDQAAQPEATKPFDPIPHLKPLRDLVRNTNVNLNNPKAVAAKLGIAEADVPRVMAMALGSREAAGFYQTKGRPAKGRRKAVPPRWQRVQRRERPLHAMEFIRSIGGVRSDNHDLRNFGNLARHPGVINNKSGMSVDALGEALHEAGFLRSDEDKGRPDESEVLEFLHDASTNRRYAMGDETTAQEFADEAHNEHYAALEEDARAEIDAALEEAEIDFTDAEREDALRYMRDGESAETAVQMAAHDAAGRALETGAEETGNDFYAELAGAIYEGRNAEPRGEGAAEALAGRQGEPSDAQGRDAGSAQPEESQQAQGSVESTAPEHAAVGVDDRELAEIVQDYESVRASQGEGEEQSHPYLRPAGQGEIVASMRRAASITKSTAG
jgi:hypothetical protein